MQTINLKKTSKRVAINNNQHGNYGRYFKHAKSNRISVSKVMSLIVYCLLSLLFILLYGLLFKTQQII